MACEWDDREHQIILHEAKKDPAKIKSETTWKNIQAYLSNEGFQRTRTEIQFYWDLEASDEKREKAGKDAGPEWKDKELQILCDKINAEQTAEREMGPTEIPITWDEFWARVSAEMTRQKCHRSKSQIRAKWRLLELDPNYISNQMQLWDKHITATDNTPLKKAFFNTRRNPTARLDELNYIQKAGLEEDFTQNPDGLLTIVRRKHLAARLSIEENIVVVRTFILVSS